MSRISKSKKENKQQIIRLKFKIVYVLNYFGLLLVYASGTKSAYLKQKAKRN